MDLDFRSTNQAFAQLYLFDVFGSKRMAAQQRVSADPVTILDHERFANLLANGRFSAAFPIQ